jgi:serine/threonine protein kinase
VTPYYSAPEVMGKTKFDGRKADVWSLGVILFIMVTGHLPWGSRHVPKLLGEIRRGEYEVPDNVTPGCLDLIRKLMQPCADDRIGLYEAVNHPWLAGVQLRQTPCVARRVISLRRLDECFVKNDVFEPRTVFVPRRRSESFDQPDFVRMGDILSRNFPERELVVDERPEGRASRWKGSTRTFKAKSVVSRPRTVAQRRAKKATVIPQAWLKESLKSLVDQQKTSSQPVDVARRRKYIPR